MKLNYLSGKEKSRRDKEQAAKALAVKAVDTVENFKDKVHNKAEKVRDSMTHDAKMANQKTDKIEKAIKVGLHEVKKDIRKATKNVSSEVRKPVKK